MSHDRTGRRRADARAFRPSLEGQRLEPRLLLSSTVTKLKEGQYLLTHPQPGVALRVHNPPRLTPHSPPLIPSTNYAIRGVADINTARGGQSAIIAAPDGSRFRVSLFLADNQFDGGLSAETGNGNTTGTIPSTVVQPQGTVRVYPMPGGQVGIIVDGSTQYQQLTIDPLPVTQRKGFAHSFGYAEAGRSNILNIGSIQINSGQIQAILGFHSANLTGPLTIGGTAIVDRIAFNSLQPGAAIGVGGTLNTLDIANDATLTSGVGISIGGNLNLFNVGGNLTLANGASIRVNSFLGLTPQPPKGTGTGSNILSLNQSTIGTSTTNLIAPSVSAYIQGNVIIGPGSALSIGSGIGSTALSAGGVATGSTPSPLLILGSLAVGNTSSFQVPGGAISAQIQANVNIVARNGLILNGTTILPPNSNGIILV
jgi:hypothetical protein